MIRIQNFIWKPARGNFENIAKFIGVQFNEKDRMRMLLAGNVEFHNFLADPVKIRKTGPVTLFAAGSIDHTGTVKSWHSVGYGFQTPEEEKEAVSAIIASHLDYIRANWGQLAYNDFTL